MLMNMSIDCPHCKTKAGELCTENCSMNGKDVMVLKKVLYLLQALGISHKKI